MIYALGPTFQCFVSALSLRITVLSDNSCTYCTFINRYPHLHRPTLFQRKGLSSTDYILLVQSSNYKECILTVKIVNMILCSIWRNFIGNIQISSTFYLIEIGPNGYFSKKDSLSYTLFFVFESLEAVKENTWLFIKIGLTSSP